MEMPAMENLDTLMGSRRGGRGSFRSEQRIERSKTEQGKAAFENVLQGKTVSTAERALKYDLTIP